MADALISRILPAQVAAADALGDVPEATLLPEEKAVIGHAVAVRVREFTIVRHLARRALSDLGVAPVAILPGADREPTWPAGVVGSLTHCRGYHAAAVGRSTHLASLGIDAEPHEPLPDDVIGMIAGREEMEWVREMSGRGVWWGRLLFSAKESVFKAWFPLTRCNLEFSDVTVSFDPASGTFRAAVKVAGPIAAAQPIDEFEGRYLLYGRYVITTVSVAASVRVHPGCEPR